MHDPSQPIGEAFIDRSRTLLTADFLPRIGGCVAKLPADDLWWRPNESSNSVGNLLLHLAGNTRQWIISGVGGTPDTRTRDVEFETREGPTGSELMEILSATVAEADRVLAALDPGTLLREREIQGRRVSLLEAIYHVVEHFSMHTGQIIYITKLRTGEDLRFYGMVNGVPMARWEPLTKTPGGTGPHPLR